MSDTRKTQHRNNRLDALSYLRIIFQYEHGQYEILKNSVRNEKETAIPKLKSISHSK